MERLLLMILFLVLSSGCVNPDESVVTSTDRTLTPSTPFPSPAETVPVTLPQPENTVPVIDEKNPSPKNRTVTEVNYRDYVDWFTNHNLFIRSYTPEEYVCGQYTVDMIKDSEEAGFMAYFAVVTFSDSTGHALVSFKSTRFGYTSWNFFEPQTNNLMTPETLAQELNRDIGKKVTEVNIYGSFDDADDSDPATWQFADPLFNKKY